MGEYRVTCRLDGHPFALLVTADDKHGARTVLNEHWRAGEIVTYPTVHGEVTVRWAKVATIEVEGVDRAG